MSLRKRALRFPGDRTADFHEGQAMGPGTDGLYRRVTAVTYDPRWNRTLVSVEVIEAAPDGHRLRYHGNTVGTDELPPDRAPLQDDMEPQ